MKILFFGNDKLFGKALKTELTDAGYLFESTFAVDTIIVSFKDVDLFVVDFDIEDNIKEKLVETIKNLERNTNDKNVPIIYVSNKDDLEDRLVAFNSGADEFVDKYDIKSLILKVNSFLRPDLIWKGLDTILVEDDRISAKFISHVLSSKGATVRHFNDATVAFEYLKNNTKVDLILTDHMMPKLTGVAFVRKIRKELGMKAVPIVFISSVQDKVEILEFYKSGGNDYLAKPLIKEELFVKVNQLLENRIKTDILKKQVDELEKLSRLKDKFLAVCSHDLRTPLNTIMGLSNVLKDETDLNDVKEYSTQIETSSKELLEMVNELLDFSDIQLKKDQVKLEAVNIVEIVRNSLRNINSINTKHLRLTFESSGEDVEVYGNRNMLTRAFSNVLTNSYKFTGESGEIKVSIVAIDDKVNVIVKDSGIGMPENIVEHLFDSTPDVGRVGLMGEKSTGLGMRIVKNIADKHGASIIVTSKEGAGTQFCFTFKCIEEKAS